MDENSDMSFTSKQPTNSSDHTTDVINTSANNASFDKSGMHTVARSIPFEPYTLPSLKSETLHEDDELTQPFKPVKQEPASQVVDSSLQEVTDSHQVKRTRAMQMDIVEENLQWPGGKKQRLSTEKTENVGNKQQNAGVATLTRIKEECSDENLFNLPLSSARSQKRTSVQVSHRLQLFSVQHSSKYIPVHRYILFHISPVDPERLSQG